MTIPSMSRSPRCSARSTGRRRHGRLALLLEVALLSLALPLVARAEKVTDDMCLTCHSDRTLTRTAPASGSLFVDPRPLQAGPHRGLECASCHRDASAMPHEPRLARVSCASCHAAVAKGMAQGAHAESVFGGRAHCTGCHGGGHQVKSAARLGTESCRGCHAQIAADYAGSIHGRGRSGGDTEVATCRDCHGSVHTLLPHRDPASPANRANLERTCARCHADRQLLTRRKVAIPEAVALYRNSVHGRSDNPNAATCNDCHESHRLKRATDPASSIYKRNIPRTCGRCHESETRAYALGVHGTALERGVTATPVCTDCHGEHLIRGPHDPNSPVLASKVTMTCSRCHEAEGIRETFGLPAGRLSTYEDSFHGLAARGGAPTMANCASCHGYHDILHSSDPRSAVSAGRLPQTCGKCHPGAGTKFAAGPVHVAMSRTDDPILGKVRLAYLFLLFGTIGGMFLHNGLDFFGKLRRHWRRHHGAPAPHHAGTRWFLRMNAQERIQHVFLLTSFFTLVYTGFALKYPEHWLFAWLARLEAGYAWRAQIHRWAAGVMVAVSLYHVFYLLTRRGRGILFDMLPRLQDVRQAGENVLYMAGRRGEPPAFERFGYIEKAEYWALIWGTVVMTITGFMLWFESDSLRLLGKWWLDLATIVHYYEAWLAFLAILVWHIYQNVLNPDLYPMNWTWVTGRISEDQLRHEHGGEWQRIVAEEQARAEAEQEAGERRTSTPARPAGPPPGLPGLQGPLPQGGDEA